MEWWSLLGPLGRSGNLDNVDPLCKPAVIERYLEHAGGGLVSVG